MLPAHDPGISHPLLVNSMPTIRFTESWPKTDGILWVFLDSLPRLRLAQVRADYQQFLGIGRKDFDDMDDREQADFFSSDRVVEARAGPGQS
jgi:hypothetical protein